MKSLEIKGLTFRYKNKFIFDNFNLSIERGTWVTIAGPAGSGKTTLIKILSGIKHSTLQIRFFEREMDKKKLNENIGFVFDNPENYFTCETVQDELAFSLENLTVAPKTIKKKIDEISKLLNLEDILYKSPFELSGGEKEKLAIGCALVLEPRIIILDEAFMMIDINERNAIMKKLRKYIKDKRLTVISFTHDLGETLFSDRLVVLNDGKIILDGTFPYVYEHENVMRKIGLEVPFIIELCQKLKVYNLIDNIIMDDERVVDELWK